MADGSLIFDTRINQSGFNAGVNNIGSSLKSVLGTVSKLGAAIGVAFGVKQLIDFGKKSIAAASDLQEVQNVVDTAFGSMSYKMEKFANTALKTYGISKTTAKNTGSVYMAMGKSLGLSMSEASDMALTLTGLSADMASFYNVEQEVADTAIKSVYTGETETLKRYGIVMTETNLSAFALAQGITKSYSAMTQAEKVQLRYAYVLEQTKLAQGDFAKTSDGWANQTRLLSEKWSEFSTIIGNALMQVALPIIRELNNVMDSLITTANNAYNALAQLFGWETQTAASSAAIADNTADSVANQEALTDATNATAKAAKAAVMGFDEINKLTDSSSDSTGGTVGTVAGTTQTNTITANIETDGALNKLSAFDAKIKAIFSEIKKWYDSNFKPIFSGLAKDWGKQLEVTKSIFKRIFTDIKSYCEPLGEWFKGDFTTYLKTALQVTGNTLTNVWTIINNVLGDVWTVVDKIARQFITTTLPVLTQFATEMWQTFDTAFGAITEIFNTLWDGTIYPIITLISDIWVDLNNIFANIWDEYGAVIFERIRTAIETTKEAWLIFYNNVLKPLFDRLITGIKALWDEHLAPLVEKIGTFVAKLINFVLVIYNSCIKPIVEYLTVILGPTIKAIWDTVVSIVTDVIGVISDMIGNVISYFSGFIDFLTGVFTGDWSLALDGIIGMGKAAVQQLIDIVLGAANLIIDGVNGLWSLLYAGVAAVINGVGWIVEQIGGFLNQDWGWSVPDEPPKIPHIPVPKLATGTVVPASHGEFLAMLGDNKRETEVVSPLSTMKQALSEALAEYGGGSDTITLNINLDGQVIYKDVVKHNKQNTRKSGVNALA